MVAFPLTLLLSAVLVSAAQEVRQSIPISPPAPSSPPQAGPPGPVPPAGAQVPESCKNGSVSQIKDHEIAAREQHNFYRTRHQSPPLVLNTTLNELAQKCAEYYAAKGTIDSTCAMKDSAGENQYGTWYKTKPPGCGSMANSATTFWYNAVEDYDYAQPGFSQKTGSFTQIVWKGTKALGVGCAAKNGFAVYVALYSPPGNLIALGSDPNVYFRLNVLPPARPSRGDNEIRVSSFSIE